MIQDTIQPAAAGLRRSTNASRHATRLAEGYVGLPEGVTRWRLAAALRAAARPLALTGPMLRLLEHYIDLTYDQDWAADSEPVITRPLVEIADYLGRSERQIRNIEHALVARGLLAWRDSGNHHRKGRRDRDTHRLVYAYGPSLAPLGARAGEILTLAQTARAEIAATRRMRMAISALRRRIRADLAAAAAKTDVAALSAQFDATPARTPAGLSLEALARRRDALLPIAAELTMRLQAVYPDDRQDDDQTFQNDSLQNDGVQNGSHQYSGKPEIFRRPYTDTFKKSAINGCSIGRENAKDGQLKAQNNEDAVNETSAAPQTMRDMHGLRHIPLALAEAAAGPELRRHLPAGEPINRAAMIDAACQVAPLLGVDQTLWGEACARLSRYGAAIAILLLERGAAPPSGAAQDPIRRPPAYLRGMMARAEEGALHLDRSVRAWATRAR